MGKGDKRTRRGKIFAGSFGKSRPKSKRAHVPPAQAETTEAAAAAPKARRKKKEE